MVQPDSRSESDDAAVRPAEARGAAALDVRPANPARSARAGANRRAGRGRRALARPDRRTPARRSGPAHELEPVMHFPSEPDVVCTMQWVARPDVRPRNRRPGAWPFAWSPTLLGRRPNGGYPFDRAAR